MCDIRELLATLDTGAELLATLDKIQALCTPKSVFIGSTILRDPSSEILESLRYLLEIWVFGHFS